MRIINFILINLLFTSLSAQSLEEFIDIAVLNSPAIKARHLEVEVTRKKINQVTALPDPQINGSVFMNAMMLPMGNQLGSISAMQMFPWFGSLDAKAHEINSLIAVNEQMTQVTQNELIFRVKSAWYPLQEVEEKIKIKKNNLTILQTDHEIATAKFQYAKGPMVNVVRTDIMIEEVKTDIALLEQKRNPLLVVFNRLLNRPEDTPVTLDGELRKPEETIWDAAKNDVHENPNLGIYDKKMDLTEAEAQSADFLRKPTIGAGFQYMLQIQRKNNDLNLLPNTGKDMIMPMINLTIPIWKRKYDAAVQERQLMKTVYENQKEDMQNELASMYEMSLYEMQEATQRFELTESQIIKTKQAIELLQASYQSDEIDFEEMLRMQQKLFSYQMEEVSIKLDYHRALTKLEYLTGNKQ